MAVRLRAADGGPMVVDTAARLQAHGLLHKLRLPPACLGASPRPGWQALCH